MGLPKVVAVLVCPKVDFISLNMMTVFTNLKRNNFLRKTAWPEMELSY
jgi:hypothetical protein